MARLIVTLDIVMGDGDPKNYVGLIDEMLEESNHWGDFSCTVVQETIVEDDGTAYVPGFFDNNGYKGP